MAMQEAAEISSRLSRKFELLQQRSMRRDSGQEGGGAALRCAAGSAANIDTLKEFYLKRLSKADPRGTGRLGMEPLGSRAFGGNADAGDAAQPQASGQHGAARLPVGTLPAARPGAARDIEDLEIWCSNCFNSIKVSDASACTGKPSTCAAAMRLSKGGAEAADDEQPRSYLALLDLKLQKLRASVEARLQDANSKVVVMRHLTQLRFNIDLAVNWTPGCSDIGVLSEHTVQQVKQLTITSRVLAPAVYVFSKRVENVIVQKERELRKADAAKATPSAPSRAGSVYGTSTSTRSTVHPGSTAQEYMSYDGEMDDRCNSLADVNSIVSDLDSNCGTEHLETVVTNQEGAGTADVGNLGDANDFLSLKNEDEQRRWFYAQCVSVKLTCPDKARARSMLISDLYTQVRAQGLPIEQWIPWVRKQLMPPSA